MRLTLGIFFVFILNSLLAKDLNSTDLKLKLITKVEDEVIWGLAFASKDELVFSTREGKLFFFDSKKNLNKVLNPPEKVEAIGQGGLLDVQLYKIKGEEFLYVTYATQVKGTRTTALARAKWEASKKLNWQALFQAKVISNTTRHFGSRIAFDGKYLYMSVGDRGKREFAQDLKVHNGKILRLLPDGKPAPGNPFSGKGLPEIWSLGHRNPQGLKWDGKNLYSCEFGPRGGDELNLIEEGKNYGWPEITYGKEYYGPSIGPTHKEGMEQPLVYWVPSISPSGLEIYQGDRLANWKGSFFLANLSSRHLRRVVLKDNKVVEQQSLLADLEERIRHVVQGPDEFLYFTTDSGKIYRIEGIKK